MCQHGELSAMYDRYSDGVLTITLSSLFMVIAAESFIFHLTKGKCQKWNANTS